MTKLTRRSFMSTAAAATVLPARALIARSPSVTAQGDETAFLFFDTAEARFVEAACERLIPADASGPGARAAGVTADLDRHLAGAWGAGGRLHRSGPWQPGTPPSRRRASGSPVPPAVLFRRAIAAIERHCATSGSRFDQWPAHRQDALLTALQSGTAAIEGLYPDGEPADGDLDAGEFFEHLLQMTVESYLDNPQFGAARGRIGWRMSGYPGAHATASRA